MRSFLNISLFVLFILTFFTCKKESNPLYLTESAQLSLQVDGEPYCTEVYLQLKVEGIKFPGKVQLVRDSVMIFSHQFDKTGTLLDTLLLDSALLPGRSYHYEARLLLPEGDEVQSRELSVRTMDTTSHNFTWEIFEFGGGRGSSRLFDVAIIDENNIWAVGEIHTPETDRWNEDSTEWIPPFNAVHWDGEQWELVRIPFKYQGTNLWGPIYSVLAFGENDVWFGIGKLVHWDGIDFKPIDVPEKIFPSRVNEMWGTSGDDIYLVGNNGLIAHYNGSRWEKIESGTDLNIKDIWGEFNYIKTKWEIFCVASPFNPGIDPKILKITGNKAEEVVLKGLPSGLLGIWFNDLKRIYVCGAGVYRYSSGQTFMVEEKAVWKYYSYDIKGRSYNDIYTVGAFGLFSHFNGTAWKNYLIPVSKLNSISLDDNVIAVSGYRGEKAIVMVVRTD